MIDYTSIARVERENVVARIDPRAKIVSLLCVSLLVVILESPAALACVFFVALAVQILARPSLAKVKILIFLLVLIVAGTMFTQALFYSKLPRTPLFALIPKETPVFGELTGGLYVYKEGFAYGAVQSLRFVSMLLFGLVLCWTTQPGVLLTGLTRLRVPYGLAFMTITSLRFIPIVIEEATLVFRSLRLRGFKTGWLLSFKTLRTLLRSVKPVVINSIRRSATLSLSVVSRGFDPAKKRSNLHTVTMRSTDIGLVVLAVGVLLAVVGLKIIYLFYVNDIYYHPQLRSLYYFIRTFL